jgi:membrane protein required for colicin V production
MQILDILFIAALIFFVFTGARRGFIGEVFRLAGMAAGFIVAFMYFEDLGKVFKLNPPYAAGALAFTIIFLAVLLAVIVLGMVLKKAVHLTPLGGVDSIFGGIVGGAKTVLIFWVICLSLAALPQSKSAGRARRSFVFQSYTKLPLSIKLAGIMKARERFKKEAALPAPRKPDGKNGASATRPAKIK